MTRAERVQAARILHADWFAEYDAFQAKHPIDRSPEGSALHERLSREYREKVDSVPDDA